MPPPIPPKNDTKDTPTPPAAPPAPPANDEALIRAKMLAGLTRDQAIEVIASQKAHEAKQKAAK